MKKTVLLAFLLALLTLLSTAAAARFVKPVVASGTIYIRADGSVEPSSAPIDHIGNYYFFTDNVYDSIVVERDNIVVDGAGYVLQGTGSGKGIDLSGRSEVIIKYVEIKAFGYGIWLNSSSNNIIYGNNITDNGIGIWLLSSSNNRFYHNNFVNNTQQVYIGTSGYANFWDDGYPSGGNYWDNYTDVDQYSGPNQDQPGSDGFWDHPYIIDENNQDNYPIVPEFPTWTSMVIIFIVLTVATAIHKRRLPKNNIPPK